MSTNTTTENQTTAIALAAPPEPLEQFSAFGSITHFENAQRMARALCSSSIVPDTYKGADKIGDCVIALEISNRIGASVLAVMQNLYIVYGKPGWSSQFLISCVNASRKFTPLRYKMTGTRGQDDWGCIAWAKDRSGETLESPEVTIKIAKDEGWFGKNGSKWKTMPELMLRYRAATLFARLYAPELTMGIQTDDEIIDIAPVVTDPVARAKQAVTTEGPRFGAASTEAAPANHATKAAPAQSEGAATAPAAAQQLNPAKYDTSTPQGRLAEFMESAGVAFEKFRKWASDTERLADAESFASWDQLPGEFCTALAKDAKAINKCIVRCKS